MSSSIRSIRQELRLSQAGLASAAEVPLADLKKWERGLGVAPDEAIIRLANVLGRPKSEISGLISAGLGNRAIGEGYVTGIVEGQLVLPRARSPRRDSFKVLDLFCGTGGFSYGFEQAGQFEVTAGIDLLHDRVRSFHRNHPAATAIAADIRGFSTKMLGDYAQDPDVIIGGPPCQGFSSIRPFRALTETDCRNTLPEYFMLALREIRPRWFVFENVVGMLTHKSSNAFFHQLLKMFEGLGYRTDWRVINCAALGLPQYRERVIVVGNLAGREFLWPTPKHEIVYKGMSGAQSRQLAPLPLFSGRALPPPMTVADAIGDLPSLESGERATQYRHTEETDYQRRMRNGAVELTMHESTAHSTKMLEIIRLAGRNRSSLPEGMTSSGFSSCYSRLSADEPSTTITVNFVHPSSNRCIHPTQDRALTPREGARIQSFPDTFEFFGNRAQVVKQIGNAVPPLLGEALAAAIAQQF